MKEDLLKIINHYGIKKQLKYIHSEYFELDEAIICFEEELPYTENGEEFLELKSHIIEEIADVMVMLKQFQYHYHISDEDIENVMKSKTERQLERIEEEQK